MMNYIEQIRGAQLTFWGRTLDLVSLYFEKNDAAYCLHCQCLVRVFKNGKLIISSGDILLPENSFDGELDNWDWSESLDRTLFDEQLRNTQLSAPSVRSIAINACGDIHIECETGIVIEVLTTTLSNREMWRFFQEGASERTTIVHYGAESVENGSAAFKS